MNIILYCGHVIVHMFRSKLIIGEYNIDKTRDSNTIFRSDV